jgi:hypothetical protein
MILHHHGVSGKNFLRTLFSIPSEPQFTPSLSCFSQTPLLQSVWEDGTYADRNGGNGSDEKSCMQMGQLVSRTATCFWHRALRKPMSCLSLDSSLPNPKRRKVCSQHDRSKEYAGFGLILDIGSSQLLGSKEQNETEF